MTLQVFQVQQRHKHLKLIPPIASGWPLEAPVEPIKVCIEKVRNSLANLCAEYMNHPHPERNEEKIEILRDLAQEGEILKENIFGSDAAAKLEEKLALPSHERKQCLFLIQSEIKVHIPWGLMFDRDRHTKISNLSGADVRKGFWCMKYDVSGLYPSKYLEFLDDPTRLKVNPTGLFGIFHESALRYADPHDQLKWPSQSQFSSIRDLKRKFRECHEERLLYFFCHADENKLYLKEQERVSDDYSLNPAELSAWRGGSTLARRDLFILNGCKTAVSQRGLNWLRVTRENGGLGFIGTEAVVPTLFAWNLGRDFLSLMVRDGCSALEAMRKLRDLHWPLSLLYGLYCVPNTYIEVPIKFLPRPRDDNYSFLQFRGSDYQATLPFKR